MSDKIRAIVVDDHTVVRKGIRDYLADEPDIEVVAEASDGAEALAQVEALQPDVVLLNIRLPTMSGIEIAGRIKAQHPDIKILILTSFDSAPYIFTLLKTGISGYLLKTAGPDELINAVRAVYRGRSVLAPEVTQRVVEGLAWHARPFNWYADIMGLGAAADIGRRPWELLPRYLTNVGYQELLLGFLYIARGQKST